MDRVKVGMGYGGAETPVTVGTFAQTAAAGAIGNGSGDWQPLGVNENRQDWRGSNARNEGLQG